MRKSISILGSTGSIGLSTLKIINKQKNNFKVLLLAANKNLKLIEYQIKKFNPKIFIIRDNSIFKFLKKKYKKKKIIILNNFDSLKLTIKSDVVISAIPGIAGLFPTISMIKFSKKILIANKESIICGWNQLEKNARKYKTRIVPVDSEHFSIFKLLENHKIEDVKKIYITASGGPFLNYKHHQLNKIKPEDALKHPKWKMGKKITIDSATLMNKILELIEAQKLFNLPQKKLDILIHPESLVHAIVEFNNGLTKFIYHDTSMLIPLANAIYEKNLKIENFFKKKNSYIQNLTFKKVSKKNFPIIQLKKRLMEHTSTPIIINACNEILVDQFLQKKIPFLAIFKIIMATLRDRNYKKYAIKNPKNINQIYEIDLWARRLTMKKIKSLYEQ